MKIAIDVSPIAEKNMSQHTVRGVGSYIRCLIDSLQHYFPEHTYHFFSTQDEIPSEIDILHYPYFDPFGHNLPLSKKWKTVVTVHDLTPFVLPNYFPVGIKGKIKWQFQKHWLKCVDGIITDSLSSQKDINRYTGIQKEKIGVVYLAAGEEFKHLSLTADEKKDIQKRYGIPEKFILYVGDVTRNKNLPRLIKATELINLPLVMIGKALLEKGPISTNPWNLDQLFIREQATKTNLLYRLGFVPTADLVKLYNMATVFAMPSLYEGFGLPVIEAMACGCPVITSESGSIQEVGGNACYFVNPYDENNIATGIQEVFTDEKLQKNLAEKGLKQSAKFTWKKTVEETVRIYEHLYNAAH